MSNVAFHSTFLAMKLLEKLLKAEVHIHGHQEWQGHPKLYVVNHFTRAETFLVPYILYKQSGQYTFSLSDASLFKGKFGEYLNKIGAVSTKEPTRDRSIIRDLMTGTHDWVIYPEGLMVKNKDTFRKGKYVISTPDWIRPPRTGAAYLALTAEMYRQDYLNAQRHGDLELLQKYQTALDIEDGQDVCLQDIYIVPVNITYYPIRPGQNVLNRIIRRIVQNVPERLEEELEIEGNLLFSKTDIHLSFGDAYKASDYLGQYNFLRKYASALVSPLRRSKWVVSWQRSKLTQDFMSEIYQKVTVNLDHLFCYGLESLISWTYLKQQFAKSLLLAALRIYDIPQINRHPKLLSELLKVVCYWKSEAYENVQQMAVDTGLLEVGHERYKIHKVNLAMRHMFHDVRVKNTVIVLANEIRSLSLATKCIKKSVHEQTSSLNSDLEERLAAWDQDIYEQDYQQYHVQGQSKAQHVGRPFYLKAKQSSVAVLLSHGYLSAPLEVKQWAEYLHDQGFSVYAVRLKGHGTAPHNLQDICWQDWLESYQRGLALLKARHEKIILGGFSTGGTLSLLQASAADPQIKAVMTINAPFKLVNIKNHLVGSVMFYNDLLESLHLKKGQLPYVDNPTANPKVNYKRNYLHGVQEMKALMEQALAALPNVKIPSLIMQSDGDPVVDPQSAQMILEALGSQNKHFQSLDFDRHLVIDGSKCEQVFAQTVDFIQQHAL